MKNKKEVVYAFIDSQNVNLSIQKIGWRLDFRKFRIYLRDKYKVKKAFLFLGYIPENQKLYTALKEYGFTLVFKPTLMNKDGLVKGNCDAELVLHAMIEFEKYDKAIIVTGDGDFYCLVKYLLLENKLLKVFIPNKFKYSKLLKQVVRKNHFLTFMNDLKNHLEFKKNTTPKSGTKSGGLLKGRNL